MTSTFSLSAAEASKEKSKRERKKRATKVKLWKRMLFMAWAKPLQGLESCVLQPRVARSSQPWAGGRNPVGIEILVSGNWSLRFGASLDVGCWNLDFPLSAGR